MKKDRQNPVALVAYNRPQHVKQVLSALERDRIELLYIFIDGPKHEADRQNVLEVWRIVSAITWTTPHIVAHRTNQGLSASVTGAVDYVLSQHNTVIVLEDDCVPGPYFFDFMDTCLNRYQLHLDIMGVTGYTIPIPRVIQDAYPWDVYFFPRASSWGWGTWKRAWDLHNHDLAALYNQIQRSDIDISQGGHDVEVYTKQVLERRRDIWTPSWILSIYLAQAQFVYPMISHIKNIGFDGSGSHKVNSNRYDTKLAQVLPTQFPPGVVFDPALWQNFRKWYK